MEISLVPCLFCLFFHKVNSDFVLNCLILCPVYRDLKTDKINPGLYISRWLTFRSCFQTRHSGFTHAITSQTDKRTLSCIFSLILSPHENWPHFLMEILL